MSDKKAPQAKVKQRPAAEYRINPDSYAWYMGLMGRLIERFRLNIKIHGDEALLREGDIFLFNHFARLETTIPPYLIFEKTGCYTRSVAHYSLFEVNAKLEKFLREMGGVPSNLPGMMPLLAAEILRGQKVMIFPEGSMIKDRRVMDDGGAFGIFSDRDGKFRPLHRGAAALAVTLDLFKTRLRQLDSETLALWAEKLEMTPQALQAAVAKPTVLVPSTITFYPISVAGNAISKLAGMVLGKLPGQAAEELAVEGNLLLTDTDMDIELGEKIVVQRESLYWQTLLLERGLRDVDSLEKFFALKEEGDGFAERILGSLLGLEIDRIRDVYMERLYKGVRVNQSHLAARLLTELVRRGRHEVGVKEFQRALYLAIKGTQRIKGIALHRSLTEPERYRGLPEDDNADLKRFMQTCQDSGLLRWAAGKYVLSPKVIVAPDFNVARQDNLLAVYANETLPLPGLREVVDDAIDRAPDVDGRALARLLFDDERRSFAWRKAYFSQPQFKEINDRETMTVSGEPFLLLPPQGRANGSAVVLVHGFRGCPAQLRNFGEKLVKQGYVVLGARLAGHGTSPWDLHRRSWGEWVESLDRACGIARRLASKVLLVGFSTGAAVSLYYAARHPEVEGVVSVAAPLALQDKNISLVPWVSRLNRLVSRVTGNEGVVPFYANDPDEPSVSYRALPVQAVQQLIELMSVLKDELPNLRAPVLVMQAERDPVVSPESARKIYDLLGTPFKTLRIFPGDKHDLLNAGIAEAEEAALAFLAERQG